MACAGAFFGYTGNKGLRIGSPSAIRREFARFDDGGRYVLCRRRARSQQPGLPYFDAACAGPFPDAPPLTLADLEEMYPAAAKACQEDPGRLDAARKATADLQMGRPGY